MDVHTVKDAKKDAFTTIAGGKSAHGADPAAHFDKEPFDDVGGPQSFPVSFGASENAKTQDSAGKEASS